MKKITLELWVDPEKVKYDNPGQCEPFLRALGRQIAYAFSYGDADTDVTINGMVRIDQQGMAGCEIICTYGADGRAFTMGAIARDEGTDYSYHS